MIFRQNWTGCMVGENIDFPANVPGNIQKDYADFNNWGDINYADNCKRYLPLEDKAWIYKSKIHFTKKDDERLFFVSGGIDYKFDIIINGQKVFSQEGMFKRVEVDITEYLSDENVLEVYIHPHPHHEESQQQLLSDCKPPVSWGWDWHPRVVPSGIWNDAYIETRGRDYIRNCEIFYTLADDYSYADVHFDIECEEKACIELRDMEDNIVYSGCETDFRVDMPKLWWCNEQGEQYLYRWSVHTNGDEKCGRVGFRRIELAENPNDRPKPEDSLFPTSRNLPPITVKLNGRRIFAKGSNWVNPEIFMGTASRQTYKPLVELAAKAHMNIFRCWGGAGCGKDSFYELCDEYGILVWQEFPLACNDYSNEKTYLEILEQESRAIVRNLRHFASIAIWCGGNELFCSWSGLNDQYLAIRLLNKVCYEEDPHIPFLQTSPLYGMSHGGYLFDYADMDYTVYDSINNNYNTTYTEFGVPSFSPAEYLKTFIPKNELFPPKEGGSYTIHHAFGAWNCERGTWGCIPMLEKHFGESGSLEQLCERSMWTQCEGYKAAFEEMRRQKPHCSMAINWCYNEPWKTAANNSIINYPATPKKSYYAIEEALRPVMPSARLHKFDYVPGETLTFGVWLLNDTQEKVQDEIEAYLEIDNKKIPIGKCKTELSDINRNVFCCSMDVKLPDCDSDRFTLVLASEKYGVSKYCLHYMRKNI